MTPASTPARSKLLEASLALLGIGFLAWAGVLWDRSDTIIQNQQQILVKLSRVEVEIRHVVSDFETHEDQPWHDEAGQRLIRFESRLLGVERGPEPR